MTEALGVDVGGVIIDRINDSTDTSFFSDNYLATTAVPGVFEVLRRLVEGRFGKQVYIVSKCGQRVQEKTLNWLNYHRVYERTGIVPGNVHFCRQRHEKAPICQALGITHFIDDKVEVLSYLTSVSNKIAFQPETNEMCRYSHILSQVTIVSSWEEVVMLLL